MSALGLTATYIATVLHQALLDDVQKAGWRLGDTKYGPATSKLIREIAAELCPREVRSIEDAFERLAEAGLSPNDPIDPNKSFLVTPHQCPNCGYTIQVGHDACRRQG